MKENKKEITVATAVKAIITGYVAYGILIGFIVFIIGVFANWCLSRISVTNDNLLYVTIPLIGVILLYFILRGICKLSIYDVFKKCKTNKENLPKIVSRMNLFILICVTVFVIAIILMLSINFSNQEKAIQITTKQYSQVHSEQFALSLKNDMLIDFYENKADIMVSTIILELGMIVSWFSIIPLQKKLIEKYNEA